MQNNIIITKLANNLDIEECFYIRRKVFIESQNISEEIEIDGLDDQCDHYILKIDGIAAGTSRVRYLDKSAKIQRLAVLDEYRGRGLSKILMEFIINDIKTQNIEEIYLSSQSYIQSLYEKFGFKAKGEEYEISGIKHIDMVMKINI